MSHSKRFFLLLLILATVWLGCTSGDRSRPQAKAAPDLERTPGQTDAPDPDASQRPVNAASISVSGTVNGPGGPAPDVWVGVGSDMDWQETTTDANGSYSVSIETEGILHFHVRPDVSTRLTHANLWMDGVTSNVTQNFSLTTGYLLSLHVPVTGEIWFDVQPLLEPLPENQWYDLSWDESAQRHQAVLPPDVYYVRAHHPPPGYYETTTPFDLRAADQDVTMPLNTSYVHPIPYDPPDANRITVDEPDNLGEAVVTGAPGAALPLAHVLLVNLNSTHQAHAVSETDGSFQARIYAPPGSALLVKHGPPGHRWNDLDVGLSEGVNPFPGTILHVPHTHAGGPYETPFAAAGAIDFYVDDPNTTRNSVGSAWAITGTFGPVVVEGQWTRVLDGDYDGKSVPGLYLGGLNWTHPALGDLDGDGDLELLVGERAGHLVLYRNAGSATSPDWRFETADYAGVDTGAWAYPALVDVTGDGALDLFVGAGDGGLSIYYNQGTPTAPAWPASPDVSLSTGRDASPALDDLDGDGDLDLLVGYWREGTGGQLYHFENTGTLTAPVWTQRTDRYADIAEGSGIQPAFINLTPDPDLDLLVGLCGQLLWYERDGTPPTWTRHADDPIGYGGGSCANSPGVGDWGGSTRLTTGGSTRLTTGGSTGLTTGGSTGLTTGGSTGLTTGGSTGLTTGGSTGLTTGGSTGPDLVIGEHWGNLRFFRNDGPPNWTEQSFPFPFDLAGDSAPALADWDNDGDPDLLLGQAHGQILQYTNVSTGTAPHWRSDGELLSLPWTDHPHPFPALADIDADGDFDLFVGEGGGLPLPNMGGNVRFYRNEGTPSAPNWTLVVTDFLGLDVGGWSTPAFADIDADGDLDLFVGDAEGTLTFVENVGAAGAPNWAAPLQPYAGLDLGSYSAPAFLDVDQDGDLDILAGLENGALAYVRNTGTATSPAWELVTTAYPGIDVGQRATPAVADANGDGKQDLFIGDGDGGLNLYRYTGPGTLALGSAYLPGDQFQVRGTIRLYSPAITATTDVAAIAVHGWTSLNMLFNQDGQALAAENYFMSTLLTPGGFPIQRIRRASEGLEASVSVEDLRYLGGHTILGDLRVSGKLPDDLPPGIYRPSIWLDFTGVPTSPVSSQSPGTDWLAANVTQFTFSAHEALLPPITIDPNTPSPHLIWRLLMDDFSQGTRGTGAREDRGTFELASQIVSQGAPYYTPPVDVRSGQTITYRLEPFLPMISFTDRRLPAPPLIPFDLPGGELAVTIRQPDGTLRDLGSAAFTQSFNRTRTTRSGGDLNSGTVQLEDVYSLQAGPDQFRVTFEQYGQHVITMTGSVEDLWGNRYSGGGTYDVWVAHPLDVDPGVLPGTPLAVGDAFNPALQFYPRVPADVSLSLIQYPNSDPAQAITQTITGQANRFGYFSLPTLVLADHLRLRPVQVSARGTQYPISSTHPGEYRVDLSATYTDPSGKLYMGTMTWGGVVMTPADEAELVAHGRRGLDSLPSIPNHWFVSGRDLNLPEGAVSHTFNPYYNGDILWSRMSDGPYGGDSLLLGASVQDTVGSIEAAVRARADRVHPELAAPGNLQERFNKGEIPLFSSTRSGRALQVDPGDADQVAYSYRSSQRPGVRVRELVAEDGQTGGYWRLDTLYDDQLGVGVQGDQPNDFKFQYVGAVYRDLESGHNEYLGQGTGWIFIPDDDPTGTRVMPPFAGPGNGGWTAEGGPILTLQGQAIHIFILPTGVRPGAVLQTGDLFHFAGHLMPTLDSQVAVTVTAPGGTQHFGGGRANAVGYFYDPDDDFSVDEPGLWSVDVRVWHDGECSGGQTVPPYPSGDVLGSENGRYWFYVVPGDSPRLEVAAPSPGFLSFDGQVTPITITGTFSEDLSGATVDYVISMPGYILAHGQVTPTAGHYEIVFDPAALQQDFANLDLTGRDDHEPGLSDTFAIGLLLRGQREGRPIYRANTLTVQGEQVYVRNEGGVEPGPGSAVYLPLTLKQRTLVRNAK